MKKIQNQTSNENERWENYRLANSRFPKVREAQIERQLFYTDPKQGEIIVELGTGNGILTFELAKKVATLSDIEGTNMLFGTVSINSKGLAPLGQVITYDYETNNLIHVAKNKGSLPILLVHRTAEDSLGLPEGVVDKVSTLDSLHHYDDRSKKTGTSGRQRVINEVYRGLKKGGLLVIGDIADNTSNQRYFDNEMDNPGSPAYCQPRGHPHDFLDEKLARKLCEKAGFKNIEFRVKQIPLMFENEEQAKTFWHTVHNAKCSPDESLDAVKRHLPNWNKDGKFYVGWDTLYLTARK